MEAHMKITTRASQIARASGLIVVFATQLFIVMIALNARATEKDVAGSKCGFVDQYADDQVVKAGEAKKVTQKTELTELETQQVIAAAITLSDLKETETVSKIERAIDALTGASQTGEVLLQDMQIKTKPVTQLVYFPGGSPVGAIFEKGTPEIKALIEDTLIVCKTPTN
jgi:hypothetical protein